MLVVDRSYGSDNINYGFRCWFYILCIFFYYIRNYVFFIIVFSFFDLIIHTHLVERDVYNLWLVGLVNYVNSIYHVLRLVCIEHYW